MESGGGIKTSLENQEITRRRPSRKRYVIVLAALSLILLLAALPAGILGQDFAFQDILIKLKVLERKAIRLVSLAEYKIPQKVSLCGQEIPMEREDVREALEQEFYLSLGGRANALMWVKRSGKYFPYIEQKLKQRGMPDDLKYLAVAESDLKDMAYSPAGASGIWQFIEGTGRHYGLRIDSHIDERRDFISATDSALQFLSSLNSQFNNWLLTMAAYNAGPGRISGEMARQKVSSYYDLDLPRETERYIFRIAAIKVIMSNAEYYGLDLAPEEKYPAYDLDTITLHVDARSVTLTEVAELAGLTYKKLRDINPHFMNTSLLRGGHILHLPKGTSPSFVAAWNDKHKDGAQNTQAPQSSAPEKKKVVYTVQKGETLASIARKNNCSVDDICRWNKMKRDDVLHTGKKLIIYR